MITKKILQPRISHLKSKGRFVYLALRLLQFLQRQHNKHIKATHLRMDLLCRIGTLREKYIYKATQPVVGALCQSLCAQALRNQLVEYGSRMELSLFNSSQSQEVIELFTKVFSASEGETEGQLIGSLVSDLIATTESQDLIGFVSLSGGDIVGSIFFSRLNVPSEKIAFILSPVAIATNVQRKGMGQQLINYGISHLKSLSVDLVFTYGDPNFYSKVGFNPISESIVKAPLKLTYPEGWLAQLLDGSSIKAMEGTTHCVEALNDQKYW